MLIKVKSFQQEELAIKKNNEVVLYRKEVSYVPDFEKSKQVYQRQKPVVQIQIMFHENYKFHRNHVGCENGIRPLHYIKKPLRDDVEVVPMKATHISKRIRMQYLSERKFSMNKETF